MSEQLFDLSIDQLRKNFVQARFAEEQHFGREDVEEWLEDQLRALLPDVAGWEAIFGKHSNHFCHFVDTRVQADDLISFLTPESPEVLEELLQEQPSLHDDGMMAVLHYLLSSLPEEVKLFGEAGEAFWLDRIGLIRTGWQFGSPVRLTLHKAGAETTARLFFVEWSKGRPNLAKVREILCGTLADIIANVRKSAESDFNKAVAVSADGRKIVHADHILVYGGPEKSQREIGLFPAHRFWDNKLLLDHDHYLRSGSGCGLEWLTGFPHQECLRSITLHHSHPDVKKNYPLQIRFWGVSPGEGEKPESIFATHECFVPQEILERFRI